MTPDEAMSSRSSSLTSRGSIELRRRRWTRCASEMRLAIAVSSVRESDRDRRRQGGYPSGPLPGNPFSLGRRSPLRPRRAGGSGLLPAPAGRCSNCRRRHSHPGSSERHAYGRERRLPQEGRIFFCSGYRRHEPAVLFLRPATHDFKNTGFLGVPGDDPDAGNPGDFLRRPLAHNSRSRDGRRRFLRNRPADELTGLVIGPAVTVQVWTM